MKILRERGVFLGYSLSGAFLVGVWRKDDRLKRNDGYRFIDIITENCKFDEDRLVSNIDDLRKISAGGKF